MHRFVLSALAILAALLSLGWARPPFADRVADAAVSALERRVGNVLLRQSVDPTVQPCAEVPLLRVAPVPIDQIATLSPLATLVPPDHVFPTPHMYFFIASDALDLGAPVLAPGDLVITSIALRHYDRLGQRTDYTDYTLTFSLCRDVAMYFHHVRSLTHPALVAALAAGGCLPQGSGNETFCAFPTRIPIAAGEQIGSTGDRLAGVGGLDLGARDYRLAHGRTAFADPDRWCRPGGSPNIYDRCFTVCPLDYLPAAVAAPYLDRFRDYTGSVQRTEEPRCGDVYLDRPGTAQGAWFTPGNASPNQEAPHLFLGPSALDSQVQEFSVGTSVSGLKPGAYFFRSQANGLVNRSFADVADASIYCFEVLYRGAADAERQQNVIANLTLLVQLASDGSAVSIAPRTASSCDAGPWTLDPMASVFIR